MDISSFVRRWQGLLINTLCLATLAGCMHKQAPQVIVVGDLTKLGRELPPPSRQQPVYYFPLVVGYKEVGSIIAGEKVPEKNVVLHTLAKELAKQHYLVMNAEHPPEQLLVFWWGSMNPEIQDFGSNDPTEQVFFNEREMLALVGAYKATGIAPWQSNDLRTAARDDRYFVILMAYDFAAARQRQKKLLWMAKMSTESVGTSLPDVIPALVASGGPAFGRDTPPSFVDSGRMQDGKVILAPLEIKEFLPAGKKQ
ncbi:MAG: hypothetical protein PSV13_06100 [Lacunisphaera sp.]|nr:hypothetical protein [Lacunisphaera sp.]